MITVWVYIMTVLKKVGVNVFSTYTTRTISYCPQHHRISYYFIIISLLLSLPVSASTSSLHVLSSVKL